MGEGCLRKAFEDAILNIYSGAAPSDADVAATGVLLAKVTKASGAVAANARSTPQIGLISPSAPMPRAIPSSSTSPWMERPTGYTFTNTPDAGCCRGRRGKKVAEMLNDIPQLMAAASGSDGNIYVTSRFAGVGFTIADGEGPGPHSALTSSVVAASALTP
jgi:hypothetical protein